MIQRIVKSGVRQASRHNSIQLTSTNYTLGLVGFSLLLVSCKKDDPAPPKIDNPVIYQVNSTNMPQGFTVDNAKKEITVPKNTPDSAIIKIFENSIVSDADGGAMIKTVGMDTNVVIITLISINGETGQTETTTVRYTVNYADITADFPEALPGSTNNITVAGDTDLFSTLYDTEYTLSDGEKVKADKILVNDLNVHNDHIIHIPGEYIITIQLLTPDGEKLTRDYTLTVEALESVYGQVNTKKDYELLGIEVDDKVAWQSHSTKRLEKGVKNNEKYGYFRAKVALDNMTDAWQQKIEQGMRAKKIGRSSTRNDQYFESEKIEDSENNGIFDDHNESQLRNYLGENNVALSGNYDMGPRNGEYILRSIDNQEKGANEMKKHNINEWISSAARERYINPNRTDEQRNRRLISEQSGADLLAEGKITLDIIMGNADREFVTRDEARAVTEKKSGKAFSRLAALLQANPGSGKNIRVVTFDRGSGYETNGRISQQLRQLMDDLGVQVYYAPSEMTQLVHDDRTPDEYTVNMHYGNNNSYGSTRYMGDLKVMRVLNDLGISGIEFKEYKDTKGYGHGKMLDYESIDDALYALDQLSSALSFPTEGDFTFADYLPADMIDRYGDNVRVNTPWGWVAINDKVEAIPAQHYEYSDGFQIGLQIEGEANPVKIADRNPQVTF